MSRTDKTNPGKVKKDRGEWTPERRYIRWVPRVFGRPSAWQENANLQERRNRASAREETRRALYDEDQDVVPPETDTAAWDTF